jgi:hypothetical protein
VAAAEADVTPVLSLYSYRKTMNQQLLFACEITEDGNSRTVVQGVTPRQLVIAGWTGRDAAAIDHHIAELEALGVPRPSSVPLYYRAAAALLTQAAEIEVLGSESSGEAEPMLFFASGDWWLTVGSDHTDRKVETYSVAVSKQMCAKPIAAQAWRWRDVVSHQDELVLSSRIFEDGRWVEYQTGSFEAIRPLESLRAGAFPAQAMDGNFVSCGTLGAKKNAKGEGIRPATQMELKIYDPRLLRSIVHRYDVQTLPVVA